MNNTPSKSDKDLLRIIAEVVKEVDDITNKEKRGNYFYGLVLTYSFIENLLKHLCLVHVTFKQSLEGGMSEEVLTVLRKYYVEEQNFYGIIDKAFKMDLIKKRLKRKFA